MLASKIGIPKHLDTFTSSMCLDALGRSSYARALIEIFALNDFKSELTIAIPDLDEEGYSKETVSIEYEWMPSRCSHCNVFGHENKEFPKQPKMEPKPQVQARKDEDGFTIASGKRVTKKGGVAISSQHKRFEYWPIGNNKATSSSKPSSASVKPTSTTNRYDALNSTKSDDNGARVNYAEYVACDKEQIVVGSENEDVKDVNDQTADYIMEGTSTKGAPIPSNVVING